ncbi:ATP-dependent helicase, partial [bacterium]|nr:ATP-dependent helicase [bacterium]
MTSPTIKDLNKNQKEAVLSEDKRLLVLAGAGSGKTKTLIQKIIYLISEKDIDPSNILAITFTKNATNEMIDRLILYSDSEGSYKKVLFNKKLSKEVKDDVRRKYISKYPWLNNITVKTFHSLCYMILRQYGAKEFDNKFRILPDKLKDDDIPNKFQANITQIELLHKILYELCDDPEYLLEVKKYLIDHYVDTYRKRMHKRGLPNYEKPYTTLKGDQVGSKSEQRIADWLYRYNMGYEYEPLIGPISFEFKPDFLIKGADLYLEHVSNLSYPMKDKDREMNSSGKTYLRIHEKDMTDSTHFNDLMDSLILKRYDKKFEKIKYLSVEESFKSYGYEVNSLLYDFIKAIDMVKVEDKNFEEIYEKGIENKHERVSIFYKILKPLFKKYNETCIKKSYRDFNDLIITCVNLLKNHEDTRKILQEKFKHILVDEFQDVNTIQVKLLKLLLIKDNNLFCVGDDWQSIYGFRGSEIEFIVNFEKYFKNSKLIKLKINYRSNDSFVNASNEVIKNNKFQIQKEIEAFNKKGKKIYLYCSRKESEDGAIEVRKKVKKLLENGYQKEDLLVLSRTTKSDEYNVYR